MRPCTIGAVCALHEHAVHPLGSSRKIAKIQINFLRAKEWVVYFPEGASPLCAGIKSETLVSRKVVYREVCTEGSETTKVGTDTSTSSA